MKLLEITSRCFLLKLLEITSLLKIIKLKPSLEFLSSDRKLVDLLPSPVQNSDIDELSEKLVKLKSVTVALQGEDIDLCDARALFDEILEEYKEPEFKRYLDKKAQIVHCKAFDNAVVKCLSGNLETLSAELVALVPLQIQAKQILPPSEKTTKSSEDFATSIIKKRRTENKQATNQQKYLPRCKVPCTYGRQARTFFQ